MFIVLILPPFAADVTIKMCLDGGVNNPGVLAAVSQKGASVRC